MQQKTKSRLFIALISIFIVGAGISMILYNLEHSIVFFYPPSKLSEADKSKNFRVGGLVKEGSIHQINIKEISFVITDNIADLKVNYSGLLPPMFREKQGIVAQGKMSGEVFIATELLTKHDENYKPPAG